LNIKFFLQCPEPYIKLHDSNFTGNALYFQIFHSRTKDPIVGFRPTRRKIISCAEAFNCFAIDFLKLEHFRISSKTSWRKDRNLRHHFSHFLNNSGLMAVVDALSRYIFHCCKVMNINCVFSNQLSNFSYFFVKIYFTMKRVLSLLVFVLNGCDDGNLIQEDINFKT
jgi:hypothetical protein